MERGDSLRGSRAFEEVDSPLEAQCHRTDDQAFAGSGHVLNTDSLFHVATMAQTCSLEPVVKEAEERALVGIVATDVEERVDALIKQLEDGNRNGVRTYSSSCF
jgi:hypothetical protein